MTSFSRTQPSAKALSAAAAYLQSAAIAATSDAGFRALVPDDPASNGLWGNGALPRTPVPERKGLEAHGGKLPRPESCSYFPARQPRDRLHLFTDRRFVPISDPPQVARPQLDARAIPSGASVPQSETPSRAVSPDRVQARLEAMYAEERRVDAILQAMQRYLLALHDQMRAEEDRARRKYEQHQRDRDALQTEADHLDKKHRARLLHFKREGKDLETQIARGRAQGARIQSPSRDSQTAPLADSSPPSGSALRANSPDRLRARLDAMYVERRIDALLRSKQNDLQSAYDQLQVAETDSAAEEEASQEHLEFRYSSRCSRAFQEKADQTFEECQANSDRFWREERESGCCVLPAEVTEALKSLETDIPSAIVSSRQDLRRVRLQPPLLPLSIIHCRMRAQTLESVSCCSHRSPPARALLSTQLPRSAFNLRRTQTVGPRLERPRVVWSLSAYCATTNFATRYDWCKDPSFNPDYHRDRYYQQLHSSDCPKDFPHQMDRPSKGVAQTCVASAPTPWPYQSAPETRGDARFSQRQQFHTSSRL